MFLLFFSISQRYVCVCVLLDADEEWIKQYRGLSVIETINRFVSSFIFSLSLFTLVIQLVCVAIECDDRSVALESLPEHAINNNNNNIVSLSLSLSLKLLYTLHTTHTQYVYKLYIYLFAWLLYCINVRLSVCLSIDLTSQVIMYSVMYYRERPFQMLQGTVENNLFTVHSLTVRPHGPHGVGENETRTYHTAERERKI